MTYSSSVRLRSEDRIDTLDDLASEEDSKADVFRRLLDVAATVRSSNLAKDGETTCEAALRILENADEQSDNGRHNDADTALPTDLRNFNNLSYGHGLSLSQDEADWSDTDVVKATHSARLPVLEGILNDWRDRNDNPVRITREELESLIRDCFDVSGNTVRNYVEKLIEHNILYAHPREDPRIWSERQRTEYRLRVAGDWEITNSLEELPDWKQDLFRDSAARELWRPRDAYRAFASKRQRSFYFDGSTYKQEVWAAIAPGLEKMATMDKDKRGKSGLREGDYARAWFYLLRRVINITERDNLWTSAEATELNRMVNRAFGSDSEDSEQYDEFMAHFDRFKAEFDADWTPDSTSIDEMSEGEARDILGIGADASEDDVLAAYRTQIKDVHPDHNDDDDAGEQFRNLRAAKELLVS